MKKTMAATLALLVFVGCFFCACGTDQPNPGTTNPPANNQQTTNPPANNQQSTNNDQNDTGTEANNGQRTGEIMPDPSRGEVRDRDGILQQQNARGERGLFTERYERPINRMHRNIGGRNLMT